MHIEYVSFEQRKDRARYVAQRYSHHLHGKILDVGCDTGILKTFLGPIDYTGIDINGNPDIVLDLEKVDCLPFQDQIFDCVVCTDVLEHIDNFHRIFEELIRVTRGKIILSLPNCWVNARQPIHRGGGHFSHYGLPLERPVDRHKWFFNISEILYFLEKKQHIQKYEILEQHITEKPRNIFVKGLRRLLYPMQETYLNRYAHTVWA